MWAWQCVSLDNPRFGSGKHDLFCSMCDWYSYAQPMKQGMAWSGLPCPDTDCHYYHDVIMGTMAFQITSLTTVYSTVYSRADERKHQSSASLAFVWGIHRWPVNSPHKWPVTRKCFHLVTSSWYHMLAVFIEYEIIDTRNASIDYVMI